MAESFSREKLSKHRRRKLEKSCVTFLLCDPGSYVHKPDVHNKWVDNTHTQHTQKYSSVCHDHPSSPHKITHIIIVTYSKS